MHLNPTINRPRSHRLNHDSPLTEPNKKTEINLGEYIVLKNTSGRNLPMGDVQVGQDGNWWQFSATDTLVPNAYALVCYGTSADQTQFLSANNLPLALTTDPTVQWHWQSTIDFPDAEGQATVRLFENGKPGATLDQVYWNNPDGLQAINAYCDSTCQGDTARAAVVSLQLDDFTYDPINPWDASKWTTAEATARGKGTSQPEAPTAVRGLLKKEYELKDHLGNVHVVVTDRKHSLVSGLSVTDFKADVVVMRDYYPFGMEMEGQRYVGGEYRYGFNGHERDNKVSGEGNHLSFGSYGYGPRIGRRWNLEPLSDQYSWLSPYAVMNNNPIKFRDWDGREPSKDGVIGVDALIKILNHKGIKTLGGLNMIFGNNLSSASSGGNEQGFRYLFSEKWGWVDMKHFASGAYYTDNAFLSAGYVLDRGYATENEQGQAGNASAWDYEDLVSNLLGVYFETYLESDDAKGKSFNENLQVYLNELGFVENPMEVAPNAKDLPNTQRDKGTGPMNFDYVPVFSTKERDGELDKKVENFLLDYLGDEGSEDYFD